MNKNKKIMILICIVLVISTITITILVINRANDSKSGNLDSNTKLDKIYTKLEKNENYALSLTLDDNNKINAYIIGENARIETYENGEEQITIVKDGNTYLVKPEEEKCYIFKNNTEGLLTAQSRIEAIKDAQKSGTKVKEGEETIDNKSYKYEEYKGVSSFLINTNEAVDDSQVKTKFYYDGDNIAYVKTTDDKEINQLLKVKLEIAKKSKIDIEIPENYEIIE